MKTAHIALLTLIAVGVIAGCFFSQWDQDRDCYSAFDDLRSGSNPFERKSVPGNVDGDGLPDS
ncbi:MAG: hypothetical protein ACTSXC_04305 [Candidatus Freyarchaeota archaeon]